MISPDGTHRSELVYDPGFLDYDFGPEHPLRPERLTAGLHLLRDAALWNSSDSSPTFNPASDEELTLVHEQLYVDAVRRAGTEWFPRDELARFGLTQSDNPAFPGMHEAAALVAGGTIAAVRRIMTGQVDHAFNPAGGLHHALRHRASGFCIYNDPALAAAVAVHQFDARVLYVDLDCHHGDGVQWIFYDNPNVLTVSLHETGQFLFPGTGGIDEIGQGEGAGFSVNLPMAPFTQDDTWLEALTVVVPLLAERFQPDILISAHGADTHMWDPLTHLQLTTHAFVEQATLVHDIAHTYAGGRWLALGSGGYDWRRVVPRSWAIVWAKMTGQTPPDELPHDWVEAWREPGTNNFPVAFLDKVKFEDAGTRANDVKDVNRVMLQRVREIHGLT